MSFGHQHQSMGNMRAASVEKAKVLQPTVINGNENDSEEYFFSFLPTTDETDSQS